MSRDSPNIIFTGNGDLEFEIFLKAQYEELGNHGFQERWKFAGGNFGTLEKHRQDAVLLWLWAHTQLAHKIPPDLVRLIAEYCGARTGYRCINAGGTGITFLPPVIAKFRALEHLRLPNCKLDSIGFCDEISELKNLKKINLTGNRLRRLPSCFGGLFNLRSLVLSQCGIIELTETDIDLIRHIKYLNLGSNNLGQSYLPNAMSRLTNLCVLNLRHNELTKFPGEIVDCPKLVDLDLSKNKIERLPPAIARMTALVDLRFESNWLTRFPQEIGQLSQLEIFDVRDNLLKVLPHEMGDMSMLRSLWLQDNHLDILPSSFVNFRKTGCRIKITKNPMGQIPEALRGKDLVDEQFYDFLESGEFYESSISEVVVEVEVVEEPEEPGCCAKCIIF